MNIKEYIASGILEDYCLGLLSSDDAAQVEQNALLFNEVKMELDENMQTLEKYALSYERLPKPGTKEKILSILGNLDKEENASLRNLPLINRFSRSEKWMEIIAPLLPPSLEEEVYVKVLRNTAGVFQSVLWLKSFYPDEVHDVVQESALVLQGECICTIGNQEIKLKAGDFIEIPINVNHNITVTQGPVLAIIQRVKVA
jgi:mannose-6-phosphate isomerase-like protein (cupin superfamily)